MVFNNAGTYSSTLIAQQNNNNNNETAVQSSGKKSKVDNILSIIEDMNIIDTNINNKMQNSFSSDSEEFDEYL